MKILKRPVVALTIKPVMDWSAYADFLNKNFGTTSDIGLALDAESKMHVFEYPTDGIPMSCAKSCYKAWETGRKNAKEYLDHIKESGHGSVLEHASIGVAAITSRAITHEVVRHRAGFAFSQESQRYCEERNNAFMMPLSIQGDSEAEAIWYKSMTNALEAYVALVEDMMKKCIESPEYANWSRTDLRKKVREAARGVLPNDTASVIHMTANVRAWRHFLEMRASSHAEAGIRMLANGIYEVLIKCAPILFGDYEKVTLVDGTFELKTKFPKI